MHISQNYDTPSQLCSIQCKICFSFVGEIKQSVNQLISKNVNKAMIVKYCTCISSVFSSIFYFIREIMLFVVLNTALES